MRTALGGNGVPWLLIAAQLACGHPDKQAQIPATASEPGSEASTLCSPAWNPDWSQGSGANNWWVEYAITGGTVQSAWLEVVNVGTVQLDLQWGKWVGVSAFRIATGTRVIVHAQNSLNQSAQTLPFGYLSTRTPSTDACAGACVPTCSTTVICGSDGCGGSCGTCPSGQRCAAGACVDSCTPSCGTAVCGSDGCGGSCGTCPSGQLCSAGACVASCVPHCGTAVCGSDGCGGSCGTCLSGQICGEGACVSSCVPACGAAVCGSDGCGGSCGTCGAGQTCTSGACVSGCVAPWDPVWQQTSSANNWWVEFEISRGTVASAYLQVVGGAQVQLSLQWGKWVGGPSVAIATGASVVLHASDSAGHTAQTVPFAYLTNTQPLTDQCQGTGPTNACGNLPAGIVSITFDDGWATQYTLARSELLAHGMNTTLFLISDAISQSWDGYLTLEQAKALGVDGAEIASHTLDHPDLTLQTAAQVDDELRLSKQWLETSFGVTVTDFAIPYGTYNATVIDAAKRYYQSQATVVPGLNFRGDDPYLLKRQDVSGMTPAQVQAMIQQAKTTRGWLILCFHGFTTDTPTDPETYRVDDFRAILDAIAASGLEVVTLTQGVSRLRCP
jgi:peptidoglycan/xylan/chitin deacetylase (PgdA/CDA1 family)